MTSASERTRALIGTHLHLDLGERVGDAYRDPSGALLEGEWLGAFAQPSVVLNTVTPVSIRIAGETGQSVDEYGEATLAVTRDPHERVELVKQYPGGEMRQFVYVGRLVDGTLAGYWYSSFRPSFGGVFWLARADRLPTETAEALRRRVRRSSPRKRVLQVLLLAVAFGAAVGVRVYPPIAFVAGALGVVFVLLMRHRADALRREVELWKRQLG